MVSSNVKALGDMQAIITVLVLPPRESLRSLVSFESRYGTKPATFLPSLNIIMQLPSAKRLLLMLDPSRLLIALLLS